MGIVMDAIAKKGQNRRYKQGHSVYVLAFGQSVRINLTRKMMPAIKSAIRKLQISPPSEGETTTQWSLRIGKEKMTEILMTAQQEGAWK